MPYQFYNITTQKFERERSTPYLVDGKPEAVPDKVELMVMREPYPSVPGDKVPVPFDTLDITAKTRTIGHTLRDKTQAELAAEQAMKDNETERQTIKAFIDALKAGTGTTAERFKRVERVCAYLLKHL